MAVFVPFALVVAAATWVTWFALSESASDAFTAAVAVLIVLPSAHSALPHPQHYSSAPDAARSWAFSSGVPRCWSPHAESTRWCSTRRGL